jgi:DNA-binding protein YbaB
LFIFCRSLESQLYNKANEIQEDISGKRFDQKMAQLHLAAVRAQVGGELVSISISGFRTMQTG